MLKPFKFIWTIEAVKEFWDNFGRVPHYRSRYFSLTNGEGIVDILLQHVEPGALVLDYGCGRGDFIQKLMERGIRCAGTDGSPESLEDVNARFAGNPLFVGAFAVSEIETALPEKPSLVTLLEVVEHLPPDDLPGFLASVARVGGAGTQLAITCPHNEDLVGAEVMCPHCGAQFHPSQHVATMTQEVLKSACAEAGVDVVVCKPVMYRTGGRHDFKSKLMMNLRKAYIRVRGASLPHLFYLGRIR